MHRQLLSLLIAASALLSMPSAQAQNILERILANPKVQALLGKPAEITSILGLCKNTNYQRANAQACQDAANADMALKLPFEMRTVMSNAKSAQSMRDLCIAAQATAERDSYLCLELAKADSSFNATLQGVRANVPQSGSSPSNELRTN
jgi:pantoate kinase